MLLRLDDIEFDTPNLRRFLEITKDVPLMCAAIPKTIEDNKGATDDVLPLVKKYKNVTIVQHGYDHNSRSKDGEKRISKFPNIFFSLIIFLPTYNRHNQ